jgi:hypothetical protein
MQELSDSNKRPNLQIMGIEGEKVQTKGICNIFNKIITEKFLSLEKVLPFQVQEASRTPNRLDQNRPSQGILSLKQQAQRTERILKAV